MEATSTTDKNLKGRGVVISDLHYLYMCKNRRYGDSFSKQYADYGIICSAIRIEDKLNRLKYLVQNPQDDGADESILDTLKDIANYSIMTLTELQKEGKYKLYEDSYGQKLCTEAETDKTALQNNK